MKIDNNICVFALFVLIGNLLFLPGCNNKGSLDKSDSNSQFINSSANTIETYQVSWWNMPISFGLSGNWARPGYGVINIDNGELILRQFGRAGPSKFGQSLP